RGVVALTRAELGDPGVTARAVLEPRADLGEERVDDALVLHDGENLTPRGEVTALRLGDQLLRQRTQPPGLGLGRRDATVLEQGRGEVRQDQPLVRRAAAETRALGGRGHESLSLFQPAPAVRGTGVGPARPYASPSVGDRGRPLRIARDRYD